MRLCLLMLAVLIATAPAGALPAPAAPPAFATYCFACHGEATQEAELDLRAVLAPDAAARVTHAKNLQLTLDALEDRSMPPRKAKQHPGDDVRAAMASWLRTELKRLADARRDDPGHVVMPRLNPLEYRNVLRDLSGGIVTSAGQFLPNEGGAGEGFANVGQAQGMSTPTLEKYIEAAKLSLRHLSASPSRGLTWRAYPSEPIAEPAAAREDAIRELIDWHVAQQQRWNEQHRAELKSRLGFTHAAYLEAAWRYRHRAALGRPGATFADIAAGYDVQLAPVVLEKWYAILSADSPQPPFVAWTNAWQKLPAPAAIDSKKLREACIAIETGGVAVAEKLDFAPPYERSWHDREMRKRVEAAARTGTWIFQIDLKDAKELFLVMTNAGDGGQDEDGLWRRGRFTYADGSVKLWEDVVEVHGANSGKLLPFGRTQNGAEAGRDTIGVRPPGAVKLRVPAGAVLFDVELDLERKLGQQTVQALVLTSKPGPGQTSYYPGRMIFGAFELHTRRVSNPNQDRELTRALTRRNVSEANRTKVGLNAERNVLAGWTRTPIEFIGGPWPTHEADKSEPLFPYHLTVEQVRRNATPDALAELAALENHLQAVTQVAEQKLHRFLVAAGVETSREGVLPAAEVISRLPASVRADAAALVAEITRKRTHEEPVVAAAMNEFAGRAWRRPLTAVESDRLLSLFRAGRSAGLSFDEAVKSPLLMVLVSPQFLYRYPTSGSRELTSYDLASRLSFMLWGSIPDGELLALAAANKLADEQVLRQQVRRMLRDDKARALAELFGAQMFHFGGFESFSGPDPKRFPEFTPALRQAMLDEALTFIDHVFRGDRPLTDLLAADYVFVNSVLARHYGIDGVSGAEMRKAPVPAGRGGLPTMALFLTQRSLPLRTSPVQRGVWVLEDLLGVHLPDPPPVPPLPEDEVDEKGVSARRLLEIHRANPSCASCHDKIDPLGVTLEHFDPIGRWRAADRSGAPLTASARTADGVDVDGSIGLRSYLMSRKSQIFRHFSRKLLGYALGRAVDPGDQALLDRMQMRLAADGKYRFGALVEEIAVSPQFRTRRAE